MSKIFVIDIQPGYGLVPPGSKVYHKVPAEYVGVDGEPFTREDVESGLWCLVHLGNKPAREIFLSGSAEDSVIESGVYSWIDIGPIKAVGHDSFKIREVTQEDDELSAIISYDVIRAPIYPIENEEQAEVGVYIRNSPIPTKSIGQLIYTNNRRGLGSVILEEDTPSHVPEEISQYHATLTQAAERYATHNFTVNGQLLDLQKLPHAFCIFQSIPRSGKSMGMLNLLRRAAGKSKKIVVATTTRMLAAILYDNLYMMWDCDDDKFNQEVLLHMGRGVGEERRTYGGVETIFDMNTCHVDMIGAVNAVGQQGGNLFAVCGTCPYRGFGNQENDQEQMSEGRQIRGECRYWVTRDRLMSRDFQIAIVTIGSLEYLNFKFDKRTLLILDEMSPNVPTGRITRDDIIKTRKAINKLEIAYSNPGEAEDATDEEIVPEEYVVFPAIAALLDRLDGDKGIDHIDTGHLEEEVRKLRKGMKGTGIPSRPLIASLGKNYQAIHFGRTQENEWVFARIPDWKLPVGEDGVQVLYIDATPSPFAEHLIGIKPHYIKKRKNKWPVEVIMNQVPISRSMINRSSKTESPHTRYLKIAQSFALARESLWTGVKSAHGDFYVWGSRGRSGGEGHKEVALLSSAYQIPADISVILAHALVGADETAKSTWANKVIGKYPRRLRHVPRYRREYSRALYPYPMLVWAGKSKYGIANELRQSGYPTNKHPMAREGSLYSASLIVASELLQTIGRAFTPVRFDDAGQVTQETGDEHNSIRVNVVGTVPLYGLVEWVSVQHPEESFPIWRYFDKLNRKLWVAQHRDSDISRFAPPIKEFFVINRRGVND